MESVRYGKRDYNDYAQGIQGQHKTMAKRETQLNRNRNEETKAKMVVKQKLILITMYYSKAIQFRQEEDPVSK